jgi:hypothetical protein
MAWRSVRSFASRDLASRPPTQSSLTQPQAPNGESHPAPSTQLPFIAPTLR